MPGVAMLDYLHGTYNSDGTYPSEAQAEIPCTLITASKADKSRTKKGEAVVLSPTTLRPKGLAAPSAKNG